MPTQITDLISAVRTRETLKYLLDNGVKQSDLARKFGVSRQAIHYWIHTTAGVPFNQRQKLEAIRAEMEGRGA